MNNVPPPFPEMPKEPHAEHQPTYALPMLNRYPVIVGAICGVLLRLCFSGPGGSPWSAMAGAFIFIAPIVVGMVTVYLAERTRRRDWSYYILSSFFANVLFVSGTLLLFIEGWICAVIIIPMFSLLGATGGLVMGAICRYTNWPRHTLYGFTILPFLLGCVGEDFSAPERVSSIERSTIIAATPSTVWKQLNEINGIHQHEMKEAWAMRIGVPMPQSGTTRRTPEGLIRESRWGKGVHFDEIVRDWEPDHYIRWTYRFSPDSFPANALDDHVVIGGHYFDVIDTSYTLQPRGNGTQLSVQVRYRISTQFNLYANWAAQLLLGNLSEYGLRLYKMRSETQQQALLGLPLQRP